MDGQDRLIASHASFSKNGQVMIDNVDFAVKTGEILAVSGENGSGKTILLKLLSGLIIPDSGEVTVCGKSMTKQNHQAKRLVGYAPETFGLYDSMKGSEYLEYYSEALGITGLTARKRIDYLMGILDLEECRDKYLENMSAGTKQKLSLARCLLKDPPVILFDEPQNFLDPQGRRVFRHLCQSFKNEGKAIVICSHNLSQLEGICTSIGIMKNGRFLGKKMLKELMEEADKNSPLLIRLADYSDVKKGTELLRELPYVKSLTIDGNNLCVCLSDKKVDDRVILNLLLKNDIATVFFGRNKVNLEELFIRMNQEEKM